MHCSNNCGGLSTDNGTTCTIPPAANAGGAAPVQLLLAKLSLGCAVTIVRTSLLPVSIAITCDTNYNDGNVNHYGMDNTGVDNVTTTCGDRVASSNGPVNGPRSASTTLLPPLHHPTGIYTANWP